MDLVGQKFGRLTVVEFCGIKNHTTRRVIRGEGLPKASQPQRIGAEKI